MSSKLDLTANGRRNYIEIANDCNTIFEALDYFFSYATYLHAHVPYIECCGSIIPVESQWSRGDSKFILLQVTVHPDS
jgi:hypothetical protein